MQTTWRIKNQAATVIAPLSPALSPALYFRVELVWSTNLLLRHKHLFTDAAQAQRIADRINNATHIDTSLWSSIGNHGMYTTTSR